MGGNPKVGGFSNLEFYRRGQRIGDLMPPGACGLVFSYHPRASQRTLGTVMIEICACGRSVPFSVENHRGHSVLFGIGRASGPLKTIWVRSNRSALRL